MLRERSVSLTRAAGRGSGDLRPERGFTLVELLVVIAIAAILMSISVAAFVRIGHRNALEATTNEVRALLRRARNAAREERAPARVEIDAEAGELRAQTRETITLLRFEDAPPAADPADTDPKATAGKLPPLASSRIVGSHGISGEAVGADGIEGHLGLALDFERPGAHVAIPDRPVLSPLEGVAVEAWVYPARLEDRIPKDPLDPSAKNGAVAAAIARAGTPPCPTPPRAWKYWDKHPDDPPLFTVVRKGRAFELAITADYAVQCAVTGPLKLDAHASGEATYVARTGPGVLRPEKWARVELVFDGRELTCWIDGMERTLGALKGFEQLPAELVRDRATLVLSDPDPERGFVGSIDEVKLQGVIRGERVSVPRDVAILAPTPEVLFDALGQLDATHHSEPVVLWLSDDEKALQALAPPPAAPAKTQERPKSADQAAAVKAAMDREKAARFAELAKALGAKAKLVGVDLTGAVR